MPNLRRDVLNMVWTMRTWRVPELVHCIGADWSEPGKMPCRSYSIPIKACAVGSMLRQIKGSVCAKCYAGRGRYRMPVVDDALTRRLAAWEDNPVEWTAAQIVLMRRRKIDRFRWFDAGDVQGALMYEALVLIATECPQVEFWLPTKEYDVVDDFKGDVPPNLCVRLSHPMEGRIEALITKIVKAHRKQGVTCSTVGVEGGHKCPASYTDKHSCAAHGCTACWDRLVPVVDYKQQ